VETQRAVDFTSSTSLAWRSDPPSRYRTRKVIGVGCVKPRAQRQASTYMPLHPDRSGLFQQSLAQRGYC